MNIPMRRFGGKRRRQCREVGYLVHIMKRIDGVRMEDDDEIYMDR